MEMPVGAGKMHKNASEGCKICMGIPIRVGIKVMGMLLSAKTNF
jgi:hypothetical protein